MKRSIAIVVSLSGLIACGTPIDHPTSNLQASKQEATGSVTGKKSGSPKSPTTPVVVIAPTTSAPLATDLMARSSGRTKSSLTPMGTWFDPVVNYVPTADEANFLLDSNRDVPIDANHPDWIYKAFTVGLYPTGDKPDPADGNQRGIGDCNLLALLNSFAYQHPDFLKSLIVDKGNGVFEVSMFDPKAMRIKVVVGSNFLSDSSGNLTAVAGKNNTANWITVMEKAMMKYNHVYKVWQGDGPGRVEGFGSEAGAPMLTGQGDSYAFDRGALASPADLTRVVRDALKAGKLITGGFGFPMELLGVKSVTGHAYTVFVPQDINTMISMRNPWGFSPTTTGGADNSKVGILDIPFNQNWFSTIDLRVMEPGIAGNLGQTQPYVVKASTMALYETDYETEMFLNFHPNL